MENEADLIGEWRAAAGAIGRELALVQFDQVLGLTAGAVEDLVDVLGCACSEAGNDEADVDAPGGGFDAGNARRSVFRDFAR